MDDSEILLAIMEQRATKNISQNIVYRTSMIVTSVIDQSKAKCIIPGYTTEYTLLNKTGDYLAIGNSVIVESNGTNLNNGLIVFKFGISLVVPDFTEVTSFTNSWVNYGGAVDPTAGYKIAKKTVQLKGTIKSGVIGSSAFTLPSTLVDGKNHHFPVASSGAFGWLQITDAGLVVPQAGSNTWFCLDGISYDIQ